MLLGVVCKLLWDQLIIFTCSFLLNYRLGLFVMILLGVDSGRQRVVYEIFSNVILR